MMALAILAVAALLLLALRPALTSRPPDSDDDDPYEGDDRSRWRRLRREVKDEALLGEAFADVIEELGLGPDEARRRRRERRA